MLRQAHLKLIAGHSVRHGVRGGAGLVSILLTMVVGLILANIAIWPLDAVNKTIDKTVERAGDRISDAERVAAHEEVNREVVRVTGKAIDWLIEPSQDQLDYLTKDKPAFVSAILVLLFLATPLFSCLGGFNQTSGDIATRGLRFLLIRTERPNIFIGRFIGTYLFAALVNLLLFAVLAAYLAAKVKVHPSGDMVLWMLQGYLRLMLFSLPYIAICAWVSCAIESSFGSLVIALMLTYLLPIFIGRGEAIEEKVGYLQFLTPWGFKYWLLQPATSGYFWGGVLAMLGFTAVFLVLGLRYFEKRDL